MLLPLSGPGRSQVGERGRYTHSEVDAPGIARDSPGEFCRRGGVSPECPVTGIYAMTLLDGVSPYADAFP